MADANDQTRFDRLRTSVRKFNVTGKSLLLPEMAPTASHLLAASFRAVGINAVVMETYKGLSLGKEFTSGKECFPCQVTLGDILYHLQKEKERLGSDFSPDRYVYFLPEADGPCRFGMYNKLQRLILDRFDEFKDVPITYLSTQDAYSSAGIMSPEQSSIFRRLTYVTITIGDVLDRITWRVRPYELRPGITDEFMAKALGAMASTIEEVGADLDFDVLYELLEDIAITAGSFVDRSRPRRPMIGIVGEIYLRSHPESNQDIVRVLERFGGEVVDASLAEWINFITCERSRNLKRRWRIALKEERHDALRDASRKLLSNEIEKYYQLWRQGQVYRRALRHLDIHSDHSIRAIERRLENDRLFTFDVGTEAALSIGGAIEHAHHGFDGIVNVFPFTCMPSTICSSVLKPMLHDMRVPYLDAPYDGTIQPNRETALRTFVYQAKQHMESRLAGHNGRVSKCRIKR
jgi:predicted nucleotide-binding protein (sugar kinase/HSP70/actin superfamily)